MFSEESKSIILDSLDRTILLLATPSFSCTRTLKRESRFCSRSNTFILLAVLAKDDQTSWNIYGGYYENAFFGFSVEKPRWCYSMTISEIDQLLRIGNLGEVYWSLRLCTESSCSTWCRRISNHIWNPLFSWESWSWMVISMFFSSDRLTCPVSILIHTLDYRMEHIVVVMTILDLEITTHVKVKDRFKAHQLKKSSPTSTVAPSLSPLIRMREEMD